MAFKHRLLCGTCGAFIEHCWCDRPKYSAEWDHYGICDECFEDAIAAEERERLESLEPDEES